MASVRKIVRTTASAAAAWEAIRDIGALHIRLVPGFVVDTKLDGNARIVTFGNGATVREPIVTIDDVGRRLVWTAEGGITSHYNASAEVLEDGAGAQVVWTADFLPDSAFDAMDRAMQAGADAMRKTLDKLLP